MPKFFCQLGNICDDVIVLNKDDSAHISRVLRMRKGDTLTVCDGQGFDYECVIDSVEEAVRARIVSKRECLAEPSVHTVLFQCLPKAEKMELVIQKAVELGIERIIPVASKNCVVKLSQSDGAKKAARWQKISESAAKQSGRGIVPVVDEPVTFKAALEMMRRHEISILFYENERDTRLCDVLHRDMKDVAFMVGPEGGIDPAEAQAAREAGIRTVSLGERILRTESVALCALSVMMFTTGDL